MSHHAKEYVSTPKLWLWAFKTFLKWEKGQKNVKNKIFSKIVWFLWVTLNIHTYWILCSYAQNCDFFRFRPQVILLLFFPPQLKSTTFLSQAVQYINPLSLFRFSSVKLSSDGKSHSSLFVFCFSTKYIYVVRELIQVCYIFGNWADRPIIKPYDF